MLFQSELTEFLRRTGRYGPKIFTSSIVKKIKAMMGDVAMLTNQRNGDGLPE
jgi:hypothetical protein